MKILNPKMLQQQQPTPELIRDQDHRQQAKQKQTHVHQKQLVKGNTRELRTAERNKVDAWKAVMGNHALLSLFYTCCRFTRETLSSLPLRKKNALCTDLLAFLSHHPQTLQHLFCMSLHLFKFCKIKPLQASSLFILYA